MRFSDHTIRILGFATIFVVLTSTAQAQETKSSRLRRYHDGPLKISEFKGRPDYQASGDAYTECNVEFRFKYSYETQNSKYIATLTSIEAFSVFLPEKSWWKQRASPSILDHEQGHFDIAESTALRLQIAFEQSFKKKQNIKARGATAEAAVRALRTKLNKIMRIANEQATQDNLDYDDSTRHGMRYRHQSEQRRIQTATRKRLQKELQALRNIEPR